MTAPNATDARTCTSCGDDLAGGRAFQFHALHGSVYKCLGCALQHRPMLRRSVFIGLVIGTILVVINQGDVLLRGDWPIALMWKLPLTYIVPFAVATWGALVASQVPRLKV